MATPTPTRSRPARLLLALVAVTVALAGWAFWPGSDHAPRLGLDLRGGTQVILTPKAIEAGATVTDDQLAQAVEIIRQRVNGIGVAEADVTQQGSGAGAAIVVSVPGVSQERLVELVGSTALLDFRPVYTVLDPAPATASPTASPAATPTGTATAAPTATSTATAGATATASAEVVPSPTASPTASPRSRARPAATASPTGTPAASPAASPTGSASPSPSASPAATRAALPQSKENTEAFQAQVAALDCTSAQTRAGGTPDDPTLWLGSCGREGTSKYLLQPAFIKGTNVTGASAALASGAGGWTVQLQFDDEGARKLTEESGRLVALPECGTGQAPCNAFAIVLDGVVYSAPRFQQQITGGNAEISGTFTQQEAQDLANVLKYGALPITLDVAQVESVSPTLGDDQLTAGLLAGAIGLALVVLFLVLYYRALGVVAVASLLVAAGLTYGAFVVLGRTIGFTLTLAGIAGAIVAIGVTADSFIVYFERIRDELRDGRTMRVAAEVGWQRAKRTILAADFVSLLAAVVLYWLSVGGVRGFAFTLGLTTVIDVAVAFWFTHPLVVLLCRSRWMQSASAWTGLSRQRLDLDEPAPEQTPSRRPATGAGAKKGGR